MHIYALYKQMTNKDLLYAQGTTLNKKNMKKNIHVYVVLT